MKQKITLLLCAAAVCALPSCITLTGEIALPGGGESGGFGGKIGGTWTWPAPPVALPVDSVPLGKNPILPQP